MIVIIIMIICSISIVRIYYISNCWLIEILQLNLIIGCKLLLDFLRLIFCKWFMIRNWSQLINYSHNLKINRFKYDSELYWFISRIEMEEKKKFLNLKRPLNLRKFTANETWWKMIMIMRTKDKYRNWCNLSLKNIQYRLRWNVASHDDKLIKYKGQW